MTEYTPPTEDVRNHYAYGCGPGHTWQESREDFDRWLRKVQAEAWFEGADAAVDGYELPDASDIQNPYLHTT